MGDNPSCWASCSALLLDDDAFHKLVYLSNHLRFTILRYVGRTFIMPGQSFRRQNVRKKLSAVSCVLEGRSVLLVDDSIVRGTTSREIVRIVKEAGARKVFFCSASPPVSDCTARHSHALDSELPEAGDVVVGTAGSLL